MTDDSGPHYDSIKAVWCQECALWFTPVEGCPDHENTVEVPLMPIEELETKVDKWERIDANDPIQRAIEEKKKSKKIEAAQELRSLIQEYRGDESE